MWFFTKRKPTPKPSKLRRLLAYCRANEWKATFTFSGTCGTWVLEKEGGPTVSWDTGTRCVKVNGDLMPRVRGIGEDVANWLIAWLRAAEDAWVALDPMQRRILICKQEGKWVPGKGDHTYNLPPMDSAEAKEALDKLRTLHDNSDRYAKAAKVYRASANTPTATAGHPDPEDPWTNRLRVLDFCTCTGWSLAIKNNRLHWIFTDKHFVVEWWPTTGKYRAYRVTAGPCINPSKLPKAPVKTVRGILELLGKVAAK